MTSQAYAASGVDIDAGNRAVELMKSAVRSTYSSSVLSDVGAFGGQLDIIPLQFMQSPVLVASTDGVGTKVRLAAQAGRYESIGHDIVNHSINDILVQGARPLFFMDYVASAKLDPAQVVQMVNGMAAACRAAGCAILGGETAEMPGVYAPGEFDVAGTIVGVVERTKRLPRTTLSAGDVLLGLASNGPHTNGYSLIRQLFADVPLDTVYPELGVTLADALLAPHRSYLRVVEAALYAADRPLKAMAHLTGGGLIENLPRVLPEHLRAEVSLSAWPVAPLFQFIQQRGALDTNEMFRVFNMGIGLILIVAPGDVAAVQALLPEPSYVLGSLVPGDRGVQLVA
jgi:phosphoribosylformylglycinamidine cyclo-ligase/phosphoribosylamine--glycine ligase/phosphoribosylformylglycinamidine cyclo-ligase